MKTKAYFCDLCAGDGELNLAVARYWNDEGQEWHCCKKHFGQIREAGLKYERFPEEGNVNLSKLGY